MRLTDEILNLDEAEDFISRCGKKEEALLLQAILRSLSFDEAQRAADKAGYILEQQ